MRAYFPALAQRKSKRVPNPAKLRDYIAIAAAFLTVMATGFGLSITRGASFLVPGPLTNAHAAIAECKSCHARAGAGKLSWVYGLTGGAPHGDSKACLDCHKMAATALKPHGVAADVLERRTQAMRQRGLPETPANSRSLLLQTLLVPAGELHDRGVACATCHKEHRGAAFNLTQMRNEQCRGCHVNKFESFDKDHPAFNGYPFKRRTRIVYDHAAHFSKHFPEVAKKDTARRVPETCATCHAESADKAYMATLPFEQTCASCHVNQINGKERVSGPKGIAFLTLPGLDVAALKSRNANIGVWPEASEAALSPFTKVMLERTERGRAIVAAVNHLNLQDLRNASDAEIAAVANLAWEIKALFRDLIGGSAATVLRGLKTSKGAPGADVIATLTAGLPRDVLVSAQREWLPSLAADMAKRRATSEDAGGVWEAVGKDSAPHDVSAVQPVADAAKTGPAQDPVDEQTARRADGNGATETATHEPDGPAQSDAGQNESSQKSGSGRAVRRDPQPCVARLFGQCLMYKEQKQTGATKDADASEETAAAAEAAGKAPLPRPGVMRAGLSDVPPPASAPARGAEAKPVAKAADGADELLFPTADELREIQALTKGKPPVPIVAGGTASAQQGKVSDDGAAANAVSSSADPAQREDADSDAESWAENGGWYRQDYAISYRPKGHADGFISAWLTVSAAATKVSDGGSSAGDVFKTLTHKDAPGACTKCHSTDVSTDGSADGGRTVNFSPVRSEPTEARFTRFTHAPHVAAVNGSGLGDKGCFACHAIEPGNAYLKSYEQGNPAVFASNFAPVKQETCRNCHTAGKAGQECTLCHAYHAGGAGPPDAATKNRLP